MNQLKKWDKEIEELESFFSSVVLPAAPVSLSKGITISNSELFVKSHLDTVKQNNGNDTFLPYLQRLITFKIILKQ